MKRRFFVIAVIALISSLAPVTAAMMFCAQAPCCFGEVDAGPAFTKSRAGCCTPVACYEPPAQKLPNDTAAHIPATTTSLPLAPSSAVNPVIVAVHRVEDASPPRSVGRRLAVLSTLLI